MIKPLFVFVNFSENEAFEDNGLWDFSVFESKCWSITEKMQPNNGYDKTDVEVLFSNGGRFGVRLDLAPECRGFQDLVLKRLRSTTSPTSAHESLCLDFLKSVEF